MMLLLLSPAKKLDFDSSVVKSETTQPVLLNQAKELVEVMKSKTQTDLQSLMGISPKLAELNVGRFKQFSFPFSNDNAKPALYTFKGDVYANIKVDSFTEADDKFAQDHVRILSGLYGLLKPMDLMQPYRLEMGTKLVTNYGEDLYDFWGDKITEQINHDLHAQGDGILLNLASQEYAKSVDFNKVKGQVIVVEFKEHRNGTYKTIGLLAKRARGMCTDYIVRQRVSDIEMLKSFSEDGYMYNESLSSDKKIVFTR